MATNMTRQQYPLPPSHPYEPGEDAGLEHESDEPSDPELAARSIAEMKKLLEET